MGGGCHPEWSSAHRQVVHGGAHSPGSPGCRSTRPLPRIPHLLLYPPSEARGDDSGGVTHGESAEGRQGEAPGLGRAQEKSGGALGQVVFPVAHQVVQAWPCGPQGSR